MNSEEGSSERSGRPAQTEREAQPARVEELWEAVFSRDNLNRALQRVESNKGAPGVDAMTVAELRPWLKVHWPEVRRQSRKRWFQYSIPTSRSGAMASARVAAPDRRCSRRVAT